MGSSSSTSQSTSIASQNVKERVQALYVQIREGNKKNFYELFRFERYSSPSQSQVAKAYRTLAFLYHPDKNPPQLKKECEGIMCVLVVAKETLMSPKKKAKYDRALRRELDEQDGWDTFRWMTKVFGSTALILGGSASVFAGIVGAVPSGGATVAAGIGGSAMLSAGMSGFTSHRQDPDESLSEFGLDATVGALQGATLGAIGAGVTPMVARVSTLAYKVSIFASAGAVSNLTYKAIGDASAVVREKKTMAEAFASANAVSYAKNALIGGILGGVVGAVAHGAESATQLSDDAVTIGQMLKREFRQQFEKLRVELKVTEPQGINAIYAAQSTTGLSVASLMAGYTFNHAEDKWLSPPTARERRQPRYMKVARGECTIIKAAPIDDLAFESKVASPLTLGNCIHAYTKHTPLYRNVNTVLRSDDERLEEYAAYIWHTKLEIKSLAQEHGVYTGFVWRGAKLEDEQLNFYEVGRTFLFSGFTSTSKNREQALDFVVMENGNALFEIDCNGEGLTYCVDVTHISAIPAEEEVLFFPYSGFIVKDVTIENGITTIFLKTMDTFLVEEHNKDND